jgi:hypothetical protein
MPRTFLALCVANLACFLAAGALGLGVATLGHDRHIVLSVFTLLLSCLLQVLVFTYFTISTKVIAQAVHLGALDPKPIHASRVLKKKVTRAVGGASAAMLVVTATGAAAWRTGAFSIWHFGSAMLVVVVHALAWSYEYAWVLAQSGLLANTLQEYNRKRGAR